MKRPRSSVGFSLVEVLVALGMISIVSMSVASFFTNQLQSQTKLAQKYEILALRDSIGATLMDPATCKCQLASVVLTSAGVSGAPSKLQLNCSSTATVLVEAGKKVPGSQTNLEVSTIALQPEGTVTLGARAKLNLIVNFKFDPKIGQLRPLTIPKIVTTSVAGAVTGCEADTTTIATICPAMGGTYDLASGTCALSPVTNFSCPPGTVITGFTDGVPQCSTSTSSTTVSPTPTPSGTPSFASYADFNCSSGQAITGFRSTGAPICRTIASTSTSTTTTTSACAGTMGQACVAKNYWTGSSAGCGGANCQGGGAVNGVELACTYVASGVYSVGCQSDVPGTIDCGGTCRAN